MTEAGISADPAQSNRSTSFGAGGVLAIILRRLAEIRRAAAAFFRPSHPESTEVQDESGVAETEDAAAAVSPAADANIDRPQIAALADFVPDQPEIDRRRNLVRIYFNDFWSEVPHKPAGFAERLDAAEEYLNERLAANGEFWRLDATMRVTLGLPARSKSSVGRPASG